MNNPNKATVFIVLTAAIVISGEIAKPGEVVEVSNSEARDLLERGKARLATSDDGVDVSQGAADESGEAGAAEKEAISKKAAQAKAAKPNDSTT